MAELIRVERFGAEGVPREFTFSEIEEIGHQVGQMAASEVDRALVDDHRQHFVGEHPCPGCARLCMCRGTERDLATRDGPVPFGRSGVRFARIVTGLHPRNDPQRKRLNAKL